jgi:peptide-methionine (S)-S-oxide reductase
MRQGNDIGTQYRSGIYAFSDQDLDLANESKIVYEERLKKAKYSEITTEIKKASKFYFAEEYHQQYLAKNPNGYCSLKGTGIKM